MRADHYPQARTLLYQCNKPGLSVLQSLHHDKVHSATVETTLAFISEPTFAIMYLLSSPTVIKQDIILELQEIQYYSPTFI